MRTLLLLLPILLWGTEHNSTTEIPPEDQNMTVKTEESFLLEYEYGRMLYNNPRGISCAKCHGKEGQGGQKIAKYYDDDRNPKILKGLDITGYSLEQLTASLENRFRDENNRRVRHKIMPMYYLTPEEVKAIHTYLKTVREND